MDKDALFQSLSDQPPALLLDLLGAAFDEMGIDQRRDVFGKYVKKMPPTPVDGERLLDEVEIFQRQSLASVYYAPFNVNSKNWMHVPAETKEWFEHLGDLLKDSVQLTAQSDHLHAVACFGILYELIDAMESGKEIVFGDEIGGWMIPGDEKAYTAAYFKSLAAVATPVEFAAAAVPLLKRDSWRSFFTQAYASAVKVANKKQKAHLEAEIERLKIKTKSK